MQGLCLTRRAGVPAVRAGHRRAPSPHLSSAPGASGTGGAEPQTPVLCSICSRGQAGSNDILFWGQGEGEGPSLNVCVCLMSFKMVSKCLSVHLVW